MTKNVYRSAQGKMVDMGKLMLQNERERAVGNMKVNARGDLVNDRNEVISSRNEQVKKTYTRQVKSTGKNT